MLDFVDAFYLYGNYVADGENVARVLDKFVGNLGNVQKSVVVHADVDKRAEVNDVSHSAFELHTLF